MDGVEGRVEGVRRERSGRVKGEVLAINVSLREQCTYNAPVLPGKRFFHFVPLLERDRMHWFPIIICREIKSVTGLLRIKGGCY